MDAFSGTGSVAVAAAQNGWRVSINDSLTSAVSLSKARLLSVDEAPFAMLGGYEAAILRMNSLPGERGFITRSYSPAAEASSGTRRMYFTEDNAHRLDAWRTQIGTWTSSGEITPNERDLLIADLLQAANASANTAGTYGSYLKKWGPGALRPAMMKNRSLRPSASLASASVGRAEDLIVRAQDTVYLDPPYTKRQYAAYYHVLETLAIGDNPELTGSTGLRPWRHLASDFSYRSKAIDAIVGIISGYAARRILLSYSDEGHADLDQLEHRLGETGVVTKIPLGPLLRYTPNAAAVTNKGSVEEYIIEVVKPLRSIGPSMKQDSSS